MLAESRLLELMASGEFRLTYHWDPRQQPPDQLAVPEVSADDAAQPAAQAFRTAFFGDRLGLTLGPLVMSHRYAKLRGRKNFRDMAGVFDLRETDNRIELRPGESVTVNTIENVTLGGSLAAVTLPRLTHATAGLVLSPSYIDPHWQGVLVLHLVNLAGHRLELRFGERIAVTRIYEIAGPPLDDQFRARFAEKSHHFGLSWARVLNGADPFPLRKGPPPTRLRPEAIAGATRKTAAALAAGGFTLLFFLGLIYQYGRLSNRVDETVQLESQLDRAVRRIDVLDVRLDEAETDVRKLQQRRRSVRPSG
jgi:dUTPase